MAGLVPAIFFKRYEAALGVDSAMRLSHSAQMNVVVRGVVTDTRIGILQYGQIGLFGMT